MYYCERLKQSHPLLVIGSPMMKPSIVSREGGEREYRVTIKERYKVLLHCEPNLRSSDLLRLLGANQIWSI